jgi:HEAT repeat protein
VRCREHRCRTLTLADWKEAGAIPTFLTLLHDEDPNVRGATLRAVATVKDPRAIEPLVALLGKDDQAAAVLTQLGPTSEAALLARFDSADDRVRVTVCRIRGEIGGMSSLEKISRHLSREGQMGFAAEDAVERIRERLNVADKGTEEADSVSVDDALLDIKAGTEKLLVRGCRALAKAKPDPDRAVEVLQAVFPLADHKSPFVHGAAMEAVATWYIPLAMNKLIRLSAHEQTDVRYAAIKILGTTGEPAAAAAVVQRLAEGLFPATDALRSLGPLAEEALISAAEDTANSDQLRICCLQAFRDFGTKKSMARLEALTDVQKYGQQIWFHASWALNSVRASLEK